MFDGFFDNDEDQTMSRNYSYTQSERLLAARAEFENNEHFHKGIAIFFSILRKCILE